MENIFERFDGKFELFAKKGLGSVRVLRDENGESWFVGTDICKILGLKNAPKAFKDRELEKNGEIMTITTSYSHSGTRGGAQTINVVTESGMYALVLGSTKPEAKVFQRWVTKEVLPSIRKHGGYIDGLEDLDKEDQFEVFEKIEVLAGQVKYLKKRRRELRKQKARLQSDKKKLKGTVSKLKTEVSLRDRDLDDYTKIVVKQTEDYAALLKENKELKGEKPVSTVKDRKKEEPVIFVDKYGFRYTSSEMCLRKEER